MRRSLVRHATRAALRLSDTARRLTGRLPPYGVLKLALSGRLPEQQPEPRLFGLLRRATNDYFTVLTVLRWAAADPRLHGVLIHCNDLTLGWAKAQELRRALSSLREHGKRVWVHLTQVGLAEYVAVSSADRILLTPAGTLDITGLSSEVTFLFGALQKLGIEAEVVQFGRYKAMGETFTRTAMSDAHREMVEGLIDDLYGQAVDAVADGRGLDPETARTRLASGPFLGREALAGRLVDGLAYEDEAEAALRAECDNAETIALSDYVARRGREVRATALRRRRACLALLELSGTVKTGDSAPGSELASAFGATTTARDLRTLRERKDIDAVVLRISSPGGSGLASDLIWREVARTRETKPVVVSFGDVAASGGYYIGVAGSPVFAEAGTLTGSIGVVAGKATVRGLYDRIGVTKEVVSRGQHVALTSAYLPLSEADRECLRGQAESFYRDFVAKVASARKLSEEAVHEAAEGRVWTGRQAWARGLVDQVGGLEDAFREAKRQVGREADEPVVVERFPKPRRLWRWPFAVARPYGGLSALGSRLHAFDFLAAERLWAILPLQFRFF